MLNEWHRRTRK